MLMDVIFMFTVYFLLQWKFPAKANWYYLPCSFGQDLFLGALQLKMAMISIRCNLKKILVHWITPNCAYIS